MEGPCLPLFIIETSIVPCLYLCNRSEKLGGGGRRREGEEEEKEEEEEEEKEEKGEKITYKNMLAWRCGVIQQHDRTVKQHVLNGSNGQLCTQFPIGDQMLTFKMYQCNM